jgi:hypothetical protein
MRIRGKKGREREVEDNLSDSTECRRIEIGVKNDSGIHDMK